MAKKRSKKKNKLFIFVAIALGLASTLTMFLPAVKTGSGDYTTFYSGTEVIFGKEFLIGELQFSFLALLGFFLPLIAGIVLLLAEGNKLLKLVSVLCFIGSAVLLFILPTYLTIEIGNSVTKFSCELAYGAIISGILAAFGGLVVVYDIIK